MSAIEPVIPVVFDDAKEMPVYINAALVVQTHYNAYNVNDVQTHVVTFYFKDKSSFSCNVSSVLVAQTVIKDIGAQVREYNRRLLRA